LAEEAAVSRKPIRETLQTLAFGRLIEVADRRGAVLASPSPRDAKELPGVRGALEAAAGRTAVQRRDPAVVEYLNDIVAPDAAAIEAGRIAGLPAPNTAFHAGVGRAEHENVFAELMPVLRDCRAPPLHGSGLAFTCEA
jgi:DNA-binding GntR family transcriptional regulator